MHLNAEENVRTQLLITITKLNKYNSKDNNYNDDDDIGDDMGS